MIILRSLRSRVGFGRSQQSWSWPSACDFLAAVARIADSNRPARLSVPSHGKLLLALDSSAILHSSDPVLYLSMRATLLHLSSRLFRQLWSLAASRRSQLDLGDCIPTAHRIPVTRRPLHCSIHNAASCRNDTGQMSHRV